MGVVLITGGAGYIGSHAAWAVLDAGLTPVLMDDLSTGHRDAVPPGTVLAESDVTDVEAVREVLRLHRPVAVMHFAGRVVAPESVTDPLSYYLVNTAGTLSLVQACVREGVDQIVLSSTAAVYGGSSARVREDSATSPQSPYGWSKLMAERILWDAALAHGLRVIALRYFNVAGADHLGRTGQRLGKATHLMRAACDVALGQRPFLEVFGDDWPTKDGTGVRDFIHVTDLARAHMLALRRLSEVAPATFEIFNLGSGTGWSVNEVVTAVGVAADCPITTQTADRRPGDMPELVADPAKAKALLGWTAEYDLKKMAADALMWQRRQIPSVT